MLQPGKSSWIWPRLASPSGHPAGAPALVPDDTRCEVCHHEQHGDRACPKPYCLCDGDGP
jgi:hypothetical protein